MSPARPTEEGLTTLQNECLIILKEEVEELSRAIIGGGNLNFEHEFLRVDREQSSGKEKIKANLRGTKDEAKWRQGGGGGISFATEPTPLARFYLPLDGSSPEY